MAKKYKEFVYKRRYKVKSEPYLMDLLDKVEKNECQRAQLWGMCSKAEIAQRELEGMVDNFELRKEQNQIVQVDKPGFENMTYEKMNSEYAVKRYMRSAADTQLNDPTSVRPPFVLRQTSDYLISILDDEKKPFSTFRFKSQ